MGGLQTAWHAAWECVVHGVCAGGRGGGVVLHPLVTQKLDNPGLMVRAEQSHPGELGSFCLSDLSDSS